MFLFQEFLINNKYLTKIIIANPIKIPTRLQKNPKLYFIDSTSAINHLILRRGNLNSFFKHRDPRTSTISSLFSFHTTETENYTINDKKKRNFNFFSSLLYQVFVAFFIGTNHLGSRFHWTKYRDFLRKESTSATRDTRQSLIDFSAIFLSHLAGEVVWITNFRCRLMNESESDNEVFFSG